MQLALGILLLLCFLVGVVAVMRGQSPIIVLMLLAILWAAMTGAPLREVLGKVIDGGATAYAGAVILIVFGAWFGQVLVQTGIAESLIRSAVELAGDRRIRSRRLFAGSSTRGSSFSESTARVSKFRETAPW